MKIFISFFLGILFGVADAGELRDLGSANAISENNPNVTGSTSISISDTTLEDFRVAIQNMTPEDKFFLKNLFKNKVNESLQKEDYEKIRRYTDLIRIIDEQ